MKSGFTKTTFESPLFATIWKSQLFISTSFKTGVRLAASPTWNAYVQPSTLVSFNEKVLVLLSAYNFIPTAVVWCTLVLS